MTSDEERVRSHLTGWDIPASASYVVVVVERMKLLRSEGHATDTPLHGIGEIGSCTECDALRVLQRDGS